MRLAISHILILLLLSGSILSTGRARGQQVDTADPIFWSDDYQHDSRRDYLTEGPVSWQRGRLSLSAASSIGRDEKVGGVARLSLDLNFPALQADENSETRISFVIDGAGQSVIVLTREATATGTTASIAMTDRRAGEDGNEVNKVIRAFAVPSDLPSGTYQIGYQFGLLTVAFPKTGEVRGFIDNGRRYVFGWRVEQRHGRVATRRVTLAASRPFPEFTPEQDEQIAELREMNEQMGARWATGKRLEALEIGCRTMELFRANFGTGHPDYAVGLQNMGWLFTILGLDRLSLPFYEEAVEVVKAGLSEKHPAYAKSLIQLGGLYSTLGQHARAERLISQGLQIHKEVFGTRHHAYADGLGYLASLYQRMKEYTAAEPVILEALEIERAALGPNHYRMAITLNNLAGLYGKIGREDEAVSHYEQALEILRETGGTRHHCYALTMANFAHLHILRGDFGRAEELLKEAMEIQKQILGDTHPQYLASLKNLALLQYLRRQYADAEKSVRQQIEALLATARSVITGMSQTQAREWTAAHRPPFELLLSTARKLNRAGKDVYPAVWESRAMVTRLLDVSQPADDVPAEVHELYDRLQVARHKLATLVTTQPNLAQVATYRDAIVRLSLEKEDLERQLANVSGQTRLALQARNATIEDLVSRLPTDAAVIDIFHTASLEQVPNKHVDNRFDLVRKTVYEAFIIKPQSPGSAEYDVEWVHLGFAETIDVAVGQWRKQIAQNGNRGIVFDPRPLPQKQTEGASPADRLRELIWEKFEPHLEGRESVVIIPDGRLTALPWNALPGRRANTCLIDDYHISTAAYGQQLYGILARPQPQNDQLLTAGGIDYDHAAIAAADPELDATAQLAVRFQQPAEKLRAGQRMTWRSLNGMLDEVTGIAQLYRTARQRTPVLLKGRDASESEVMRQARHSRYLHLATHGFFQKPTDEQGVLGTDLRNQYVFDFGVSATHSAATVAGRNPLLLSGVVLSGANLPTLKDPAGFPTGRDGILLAEEVLALELGDTELVVLSACDTGLGEVANGEGVFGLQSAFHQVGARAVVASLWKVDDAATRALMLEFYANLWQRGMGKLEALRQAQLTMIRRYDPAAKCLRTENDLGDHDGKRARPLAPYYWSAFTLSGDWR